MQCQSKQCNSFYVYHHQSRRHQPFSLFGTLKWKGGVTRDKKILLASQKGSKQLVGRLGCNIYSQQNWTYLDSRFKTGQICKIMQIWILASPFIFPGFGTFRMRFTFCVERWVGEGPNSRGGCKFLYHPNVRSAKPQCAANCLQIYLSCSVSVTVIIISW